jgi:hypothetical protein
MTENSQERGSGDLETERPVAAERVSEKLSARELTNSETIERILLHGTGEELITLREFHGVPQEKFSFLQESAKLRRKVIDQKYREQEERRREKPFASDEEFDLGCYREDLEPQVRDVVFKLYKKGYVSIESGFTGLSPGQYIGFTKEYFHEYHPSDSLVEKLTSFGVQLDVEPSRIEYRQTRILSVEELTQIWGMIEEDLSESGESIIESDVASGEHFRESQRKLRKAVTKRPSV